MTLYADSVAFNGSLMTLARDSSRATALAVRDGRFVAVGSDRDILSLAGPETSRLDLVGKTVVPGFIDAHLHLFAYGATLLRQADLIGTARIDDLLARLDNHASCYDGPWIQGRGFDQEKMAERRFPTRADLDRVSSTRPIVITRVCGHAAVANSAALALIDDVERAAGDAESGLYTEGDIGAFYRRIPALSDDEAEEAVLRASSVALASGITSVGTLLDTSEQMGAYARLRRKNKLPLRVTAMPPYTSVSALHANGVGTGFGDEWLRFGAAKLFSDGSLGARTALLASPYADEDRPDNLGIRIYDTARLNEMVADAQAKRFQIAIHAIGDQAVRESLDAVLNALGPEGDNAYHRHRIEHASLLPPDDMKRMADRKIVAVIQPQFITSDVWTGERVGPERGAWAYPFKAMLDAGIPLALSSDAPVERLDSFVCLAAAVGRHEWTPNGGLSPEEAIRAYCLGSAYAAHNEDRVGSLEVGKLADFVVLSDDPTRLGPTALAELRAEQVFVGGRSVRPAA